MIFTFYADFYYRKVKHDVEAETFREARNKFFEEHKDVIYRIETVWCEGELVYKEMKSK